MAYKFSFLLICFVAIISIIIFLQSIWPQIIVPRFLSHRHILAYYALDKELHFKVSQFLHSFPCIGQYEERDDGTAIIRLLVPVWKEQIFMRRIKSIEGVEVL